MKLTRKRRDQLPESERAKRTRDSTLRQLRGVPAPTPSQDEQRHRRRQHLQIHYTGTFDLAAEITAILTPLAQRSDTHRYPHIAREVTTAVHECVLTLGKLLVERDARRRTADLPFERRGRAIDLIVAAWERPACPAIDRDALTDGTWTASLVDHAAQLSEPLSAYLQVATPPGQTRGAVSISERVETALREVDRAVLSATRTLDYLDASRSTASTPMNAELRRLNPSRDELDALGITP
ncbi:MULTISPECIES: hypothetical protein [Rhodococcus]|uniref:hypothetical protein n=1 Tax=Rhodococcus TaxID=1827 RepID=UPI001E402937|nr:hypothetical protein [Rhodococcus pyridinivorans]MCD2116735.1 hypothetical protein [Rhodococcus pyridinivorans]MCZ4626057.1 hypothetical protein [Rhodococcus pyridinivorans]MCZ4647012.1 hypothetical protein [Rhodococcus pyridinivorans]MDJ0484231.1 hypothetical protein [Rhodococcus pyridinivorans]MDV7253116.1 hypothetical protein [Rhodococcus pyridinivorans]